MDPLFPEMPEDISALSDEDLATLLSEHEVAAELIDKDDEAFIKGMTGDEVMAEYDKGVEQIEAIVAEQKARAEAQENYESEKEARRQKRLAAVGKEEAAEDDDSGDEGDEGDGDEAEEKSVEVVAEAEEITAEAAEAPAEAESEPAVEEKKELQPVTAAVEERKALRRVPKPSPERQMRDERPNFLLAAAGLMETRSGKPLSRMEYAETLYREAKRWGTPNKAEQGREDRMVIGRHEFDFPPERTLSMQNAYENMEKVRAVVPRSTGWGDLDGQALTASGGLCAPLTPFYDMPNFGIRARPVRDGLPSFRAERGGVNVPTATTIGDITTAISSISEANDALGGTFATKSCQELVCPAYTETAVQILAHCREYGNLNAMAWPEKIAHENDITMQALDRTAETFLLDRIKVQSVNVTNGVETLGALIYLLDGIVKAAFGIRGRLRMSPNARFRALLPSYSLDLLLLDTVQTQYDRYRSRDDIDRYLRAAGIDPVYYMDSPSTGDSQLPDSSQTAGALDGLPNNVQWAIFPEGAFLHIDGGSLELGIVRDSTLNSTNDFQLFGEQFENVALIGPAQSAYWVSTDWCPSGQFPPAGTARTCE